MADEEHLGASQFSRDMADAEQRGQSDGDELNALRARIDYAKSLVDWVNQAPQPPQQTAAKTFNEALGEVIGELARIYACYNLKEVSDWLNKNDWSNDPDPARAKHWEDTKAAVAAGNVELKCSGVT
jgi:hypothetical protein